MSRERYLELRAELAKLDPERIRMRVHVALPTVAARQVFDRTTALFDHARLVDEAALAMARLELLASYRADVGDRQSGERAIPIARVELVRKRA